QRHACHDERQTEDQSPDNAVEQHLVLILSRYTECCEDDDEDEEVVDGEHQFHDVAGSELQPGLGPHPEIYPDIEEHRGGDEDGDLQERLARLYDMRSAVE